MESIDTGPLRNRPGKEGGEGSENTRHGFARIFDTILEHGQQLEVLETPFSA